jgi:hypothetical protein
MYSLYVRTSNAGTGPDVQIKDLGNTILTSANWTELLRYCCGCPDVASGVFNPFQLALSEDLYNEITVSGLEWSKDGDITEPASGYHIFYALSISLPQN